MNVPVHRGFLLFSESRNPSVASCDGSQIDPFSEKKTSFQVHSINYEGLQRQTMNRSYEKWVF